MLKDVAVVALDGFSPFELSVPCEVFGSDRTDEGLPGYDFAVVAGGSGLTPGSEVDFTVGSCQAWTGCGQSWKPRGRAGAER